MSSQDVSRPDPGNRSRTVAVRRTADPVAAPAEEGQLAEVPHSGRLIKTPGSAPAPRPSLAGALDRFRRRDLAPGTARPDEGAPAAAPRGWPKWAAVAVLLITLAALGSPADWAFLAGLCAMIPIMHGLFLYVLKVWVFGHSDGSRLHGRKAGSRFWRFYGRWFWKVAAFLAAGAGLSYLLRAGMSALLG